MGCDQFHGSARRIGKSRTIVIGYPVNLGAVRIRQQHLIITVTHTETGILIISIQASIGGRIGIGSQDGIPVSRYCYIAGNGVSITAVIRKYVVLQVQRREIGIVDLDPFPLGIAYFGWVLHNFIDHQR